MKSSLLRFILPFAAASALPAEPPPEFTVPLDRQQLIGVTYALAKTKRLHRSIRAVGTVAAAASRHWDYVARVDGYIHDLQILSPGERVQRGQPLMDLYSPDLVATEAEYLDLLKMRAAGRRENNSAAIASAERLLSAARSRLEQWNIGEAEIEAIEKTGRPKEYLELMSPVTGIVEEVGVHQGRHVSVGDHLADLVDLSNVWVWAEFYENELPALKPGQPVTVSSAALPGFSAAGRIAVIDPFLDPMKRTAKARIDLANPGLRLVPDAYVDVSLDLDEGEGVTIPASAVLQTGERDLVFIDKGGGRLEPRLVRLSGQFGDDFRVMSGLQPGERVVASANFLIDAEAKVQGALKDF